MQKLDINGINFELPERYTPIKLIGKGTYGAVVSATDNKTKEKVAIKKLSKIEDQVSHASQSSSRSFSHRSESSSCFSASIATIAALNVNKTDSV